MKYFRIKKIEKYKDKSNIFVAFFSIKTFKKCDCCNSEVEVFVEDIRDLKNKEFLKLVNLKNGSFQKAFMNCKLLVANFEIVSKEEFDNLKVDENKYFYRQLYLCNEPENLD
tara:strand:- start:270 stop:605 length:336 start_codon:yes stop_codon:yes gene_type:complete